VAMITIFICQHHVVIDDVNKFITRMVQLPATDAIEYVASCWVSGIGGWGGANDRGNFGRYY